MIKKHVAVFMDHIEFYLEDRILLEKFLKDCFLRGLRKFKVPSLRVSFLARRHLPPGDMDAKAMAFPPPRSGRFVSVLSVSLLQVCAADRPGKR